MSVQRLPWASGKTKPAPTARPRPKPKRRRRRKMSNSAKAMTTFWETGGLLMLGVSQMFQIGALVFVGATSMAVGGLQFWMETRQHPTVPTPNVSKPKPAKPPGSKGSGRHGGKPGTAPNCTRTGKPIDQCSCAARHVASEAGVRRYKQAKRIGDPIGGGGKVSTTKTSSPKVPTTTNAKPVPVGEPMRRQL